MDFLLCKLQISGKHKKNAKGDYDYAAPLTASHPHGFSEDRRRSAAKDRVIVMDARDRKGEDHQG